MTLIPSSSDSQVPHMEFKIYILRKKEDRVVDTNTVICWFSQFTVIYYRLHMLYMKSRLYYLVLVKLVEIVWAYSYIYMVLWNNTNKQG